MFFILFIDAICVIDKKREKANSAYNGLKAEYLSDYIYVANELNVNYHNKPQQLKNAVIQKYNYYHSLKKREDNVYYALQYILENKLCLKAKYLEYEFDKRTLGEELALLLISITDYEGFETTNRNAFNAFLGTFEQIIEKAQLMVKRNGFQDQIFQNISCINLNWFSKKLEFVSELIKLHHLKKTTLITNNPNHQIDYVNRNYSFVDDVLTTTSSINNIFSTVNLKNIRFFKKVVFMLIAELHGIDKELKDLVQNYTVYLAIFSSIDKILSTLWFMKEAGFMDESSKNVISDTEKCFLNSLVCATRNLNLQIHLIFYYEKPFRHNINSTTNSIFVEWLRNISKKK